jgi:hypothetical protein
MSKTFTDEQINLLITYVRRNVDEPYSELVITGLQGVGEDSVEEFLSNYQEGLKEASYTIERIIENIEKVTDKNWKEEE